MKKLILGLVLALLPQIALAEYILKGPHTTVETDGSQADGSVNLITKNAGPINFYTDNVLRSSISSTGTTSYVGELQCGGNITMANAGTSLIAGGATAGPGTGAPVEIQANGSSTNALKVIGYSPVAANAPYLVVARTKAAAAGTSTLVANGDLIGVLDFQGANGSGFSRAAQIAVTVDGSPGASNDMPGAIVFNTTPDGSSTAAQVLKLGQDKAATFAGTVTSSATGSFGWAVVDGSDNTACTSQCTSAAVFGFNLAAGATAPVIVGPSDATADICMCAGAS